MDEWEEMWNGAVKLIQYSAGVPMTGLTASQRRNLLPRPSPQQAKQRERLVEEMVADFKASGILELEWPPSGLDSSPPAA